MMLRASRCSESGIFQPAQKWAVSSFHEYSELHRNRQHRKQKNLLPLGESVDQLVIRKVRHSDLATNRDLLHGPAFHIVGSVPFFCRYSRG